MINTAFLRATLITIIASVVAHDSHGHHHSHEKNKFKLQNMSRRIANTDLINVEGNFSFDGTLYVNSSELISDGKACKTEDLSADRRKEVMTQIISYISQVFGAKGVRHLQNKEMVVNTYVHVVYTNNSTDPTNVPDEVLERQMKVLNDAFKGVSQEYPLDCFGGTPPAGITTPFRFVVQEITRTLNPKWFAGGVEDDNMVRSLRRGTCSDLNIFIHNAQGKIHLMAQHYGYFLELTSKQKVFQCFSKGILDMPPFHLHVARVVWILYPSIGQPCQDCLAVLFLRVIHWCTR